MSATNVASTMLTMLVNNPLVDQLDLSCLRVLSCGGSPQSPAVLTRAVAVRPSDLELVHSVLEPYTVPLAAVPLAGANRARASLGSHHNAPSPSPCALIAAVIAAARSLDVRYSSPMA